ncbi:gamma-glutamyl-gamma-aminobutyrate hydrolase family protein [[Mycobacterium] crassicus]|uniref:Gamma-glutamyl-gamma-aminobutyrate hydrolase family protein n=1 Tax=[Mycobacterium] crassicus TaxID=2872309 RepID=A0ABU5XMK5_9MYCO|nr:gamma-glutamyl-gamma-aminobutyrate hydrolase family protein [Mycolicibacter sp. MYC098]MEB3022316.1 gamma-glutamyl-gamma-aminobutyrate hydrolase family protein [Mycolicibacter sp. MYC098]
MNGSDSHEPAHPIIGLTTYLDRAQTGVWDVRAGLLPAPYLNGITAAGGIAVLLPPQPVSPEIAARVLDGVAGLVLTGGRDLDPAGYGQDPHAETDRPDPVRDAWEFALLDEALRRGLPVLGICRGAQVLNVAFGGTLHQHLPDVLGSNGHRAGNGVFTEMPVRTVAGTRLAELIGEACEVQCYHHQAIAELGAKLVVSARDDDGVIEAIELPGENFVLAVQWHPEESLDDPRLFSAIVDAAERYAVQRVSR